MSAMTFGKIGIKPLLKHWTARDYVQNGLIAMWDGIENAGWGVHDDNIGAFYDIVQGRKNDDFISTMTLQQNSIVVSPYEWANVTILSNLGDLSSYTYEVVMKVDNSLGAGGDHDSLNILPSTGGNRGYNRGTWFRNQSSTYRLRLYIYDYELWNYANPQVKSLSISIPDANYATAFVNNQRKINNEWCSGGVYLAGRFTIASYGVSPTTTLYNIRIYSGTISDKTRTHNYEVDKLRFNLP